MNKLWIYGCSYSADWLEHRYTGHGNTWPQIISKKYNLQLEDRSCAGYGWSYHMKEFLLEDLGKWDVDNDLVIIECSHLERMYSEYLNERFHKILYPKEIVSKDDKQFVDNLIQITNDLKEVAKQNFKLFYNSLKIVNKFSNNWYWWSVDDFNEIEVPTKTKPSIYELYGKQQLKFGKFNGYRDWMLSNPNLFHQYPHDMHQTYDCHLIQANHFISKIDNTYFDDTDFVKNKFI